MAFRQLVVVVIVADFLQTSIVGGCCMVGAISQPDVEGASSGAASFHDFLANPDQWTSKVEKRLLENWGDASLKSTVALLFSAQAELETCRNAEIDLRGQLEEQLKGFGRREAEVKDAEEEAHGSYLDASAELQWEKKKVEADLAACLVLKSDSVTRERCNYEIHVGCAPCRKRSRELELQVQEMLHQRETCANQSVSNQEIDALRNALGQCRVEKAADDALDAAAAGNPGEGERDFISDLEKKVRKLEKERKQLLGALLVSILVAIASALTHWVRRDRPVDTLNSVTYGRLSPPIDGSGPEFCSSEQACEKLCSFERGQFSNVAPIVTFARSSQHLGSEFVFMLVPLNASSARKFTLFGGGGDYTRIVEVVRDLVVRDSLDTRLVIVVYEHGGRAFSTKTLRSLNMSADALAYEALPKDSDSDFPSEDDLVVLWYDEREGLKATDSGGESQMADLIGSQAWAQHLAKRATDILTRSDRAVASH